MCSILFISEVGPGSLGGVQIHLAQVLKKFESEKGLKINLLCRLSGGFQESSTIKTLKPNLIDLYVHIFQNLPKLLTVSIVHFHDYSIAKHFLPIILLRRLLGKRTYITFHGWEGEIPPKRRIVLIKSFLNKICDGSIIVGEYLKKWYGLSGKVIYGGGDHATLHLGKDIEKDEHIEKKQKVAFVGRLEKDTGFVELLKATSDQTGSNGLIVDVFGNGSLANLSYGNSSLKLYGHVENLVERLSGYDVVVTSGYLGILEALFLGKNVISISDSSLKKDYLNISGLSPQYLTVVNSAEKLRCVLRELQCRSVVKEPIDQEILYQHFSWSFVVNSYVELWEK